MRPTTPGPRWSVSCMSSCRRWSSIGWFDRIFAGETVRVGRALDADGARAWPGAVWRGRDRLARLRWPMLPSQRTRPARRHRSAGKVATRQPNAVLVPMLTQTAWCAGQPPGAPRMPATSLGMRSHAGTREWRGLRSLAVVLAFVLAGTAVAARIHFASTPDPNAGKPAWASTWDPVSPASRRSSSTAEARRSAIPSPSSSLEPCVRRAVTSQRDETGGAEADPAVPPLSRAANAPPTQTDLAATPLVVGVYFPADRIVRARGQALTADVRVTPRP